jgi:hypothetical protein
VSSSSHYTASEHFDRLATGFWFACLGRSAVLYPLNYREVFIWPILCCKRTCWCACRRISAAHWKNRRASVAGAWSSTRASASAATPAPSACVAENKLPPGVVYRPVLDQEIGDVSQRDAALHAAPLYAVRGAALRARLPGQRHLTPAPTASWPSTTNSASAAATASPPAPTRRAPLMWATPTPRTRRSNRNTSCCPTTSTASNTPACPGSDESPIGNARKCHFCLHRLEQGALPMCVTTCIGVANFFGDLNDPRQHGGADGSATQHGRAEGRTRHQTQSFLSGLGEANQ